MKIVNKEKNPKNHYNQDYDNIKRFISYFYQIDITRKLKPKQILEVGIGNKTVYNYLKQNDFNITCCDSDEKLMPDHIGDIRKLPFKNNMFDVVVAFEILEHISIEDVPLALSELHRVSNKYVVISIPYSTINFEILFSNTFIRKIFKVPYIDIFIKFPLFFLKKEFDGEHYWEMGRKKFSIKKIRKIINKNFKILNEVRPIINHYHYFFILKKI